MIVKPAKPKRPKDSVGYSDGMGTTRCKNCTHYEGNGVCKLVQGKISPEGWCRLFQRKPR